MPDEPNEDVQPEQEAPPAAEETPETADPIETPVEHDSFEGYGEEPDVDRGRDLADALGGDDRDTAAQVDDADDDSRGGGEEEGGLSPHLLAMANRVGIDPQYAEYLNERGRLEAELDARIAAAFELEPGELPADGSPDAQTDGLEPYQISLNREEFDDALVDELEKMNDHYANQLKALRADLGDVSAFRQERQQEAVERLTRDFDGFVNGLGPEWKDVFGEGSYAALDEHSAAFRARHAVLQSAKILRDGYAGNGQRPPSIDKLLEQALRLAHGDKAQTMARKEMGQKLKERAKQTTRRPTQRKPQPATGKERAYDAIREVWDQYNMTPAAPEEREPAANGTGLESLY